jgi:OOP family OmpA-OmpF porin
VNIKKGLAGAALAGLALAFSAPAAFAQAQNSWYAGASIGQFDTALDCAGTTSCDTKDTSWRIFGGYQVNRNFAIELGYNAGGEATASVPAIGPIPPSRVTIEATAWDLSAIGILPFSDRFSAFGRIGLYRADTDVNIDFSGLPFSESDSNTDLTFGIGVRYDFTQNVGARLEWQRYSDVSAGVFDEGDVDVLSLGVVVRF